MTARPTLFLLPGLLCDETVWGAQIDGLADIALPRAVTYKNACSISEMAETVLRDAPPRFALAGHSMGGRVALEVFRQAPERLTGIALLDSATDGPKEGERERRMRWVDMARAEGMEALVREWLPPMVHPDRMEDEALMTPLADMIRRFTPDQFAGQIEALLTRPDATPLLGQIAGPALVLCGRQDAWRAAEEHEKMAAMIPGAAFDIIEDCGHMAPIERPEAVNASLRRWLNRIV